MPNIKEYEVKFLFSTGNYNNETLGYRFALKEGEALGQVVDDLRIKSAAIVGEESSDLCTHRAALRREVLELKNQAAKSRAEYEALSKFLDSQGIKKMADIPQFSNLLPKAQEELVVEIVEDEDDTITL